MKTNNILYRTLLLGAAVLAASCSEDYLETKPSYTLDEEDVNETMQADPAQVQAYVTGAEMNLYCGGDYWTSHDDFGLPAVKLTTDLMGEDIAYHNDGHFFCYDYQLDNRMGNYRRTASMWDQWYNLIDNVNTIIAMLKPAEGEEPASDDAKKMLGEAYGLRAYAYFWLINLWQHPYNVSKTAPGVPVKTEEEYRAERVPVGEVYELILSDIDKAYNYLKGFGPINGKVGLSEYAAAGIYANVLMFTGDYENAAKYAELAAAGGPLNASELLSGFNSLSMSEVLWGYTVTEETTGYYASFFSHIDSYMVGYGGAVGFRKLIASDLYDRIADTDIRKQWFGYNEAYNLLGNDYSYETSQNMDKYIQNKFRDAYLTTFGSKSPFTSDLIHMRSAEMYFVAAEAYYLAGNPGQALAKLKEIMVTRDPNYDFNGSGDALYEEICSQKRIEMWGEGCRLLDAKRRGETIDRTLSTNHAVDLSHFNALTYKANSDYRMIYHIPDKELQNNPSITEDNE